MVHLEPRPEQHRGAPRSSGAAAAGDCAVPAPKGSRASGQVLLSTVARGTAPKFTTHMKDSRLARIRHTPVSGQPRVCHSGPLAGLGRALRADFAIPFHVNGRTAGRLRVDRLPAGGMPHRALRQHPTDAGNVLPVLQPPVSVATHRRQKFRPEVVVPPDYRVVVDGHPHADSLAHGEETVAQHVTDRLFQCLLFRPQPCAIQSRTGWNWSGGWIACRVQSWNSLTHLYLPGVTASASHGPS